jgi:hypothetical protein
MILDAAGDVEPGRAIILGAGRSEEIPLAELVSRFDRVILNDRDGSLLEAGIARSGLDRDQAATVERRVADLTGVSDQFLHDLDRGLRSFPDDSAEAAIDWLAHQAEAVRPETFATGETYDLVIASCVLCQLHLPACNGAIALFGARFPGQVEPLRQSPRWFQAIYGLARRMEAGFLESLHGLVAKKGRIYLSDTVQGAFLHPVPGGGWMTDGLYRMTRTTQLSDDLDPRFRVENQGRWHWIVEAPDPSGAIGRLYNVQALVLSVA